MSKTKRKSSQRESDLYLQSIMDSFRRIVRALRTASRRSENGFGLRAAQYFVLQQVKEFGPLSLNQLAEKTFSHQSTVSVVVDGLVRLGYVDRSAAKTDRRRLVLKTTAAGDSLLDGHHKSLQERFAESLLQMPEIKRKNLALLLDEFIELTGMNSQVPHFFFEKEPNLDAPKKRKKP